MGKICLLCGCELSDDARFCGSCGKPVGNQYVCEVPIQKEKINTYAHNVKERGKVLMEQLESKTETEKMNNEQNKNVDEAIENGTDNKNSTTSAEDSKSSPLKLAIYAILIVIFVKVCVPFGTNSPEAAVALQWTKNDMGSGFAESDIKFKVVAAKGDSKFIVRCKAVSDDAKEMYELMYDTNTCYYGIEFGNSAGQYFYTIGSSERETKKQMDW